MCRGQWVRRICNVGVGDLPWVTRATHMFVNKIRVEHDPTAFRCLELWYRDRVRRQQRLLATAADNFNVSVYASQPFVRHHVSKPTHRRPAIVGATLYVTVVTSHNHFFRVESAIFPIFLATRSVLWPKTCRKSDSGRGSAPDSAGGSHDAPSNTLVGWGGDTPSHTRPHSAPLARRRSTGHHHILRQSCAYACHTLP